VSGDVGELRFRPGRSCAGDLAGSVWLSAQETSQGPPSRTAFTPRRARMRSATRPGPASRPGSCEQASRCSSEGSYRSWPWFRRRAAALYPRCRARASDRCGPRGELRTQVDWMWVQSQRWQPPGMVRATQAQRRRRPRPASCMFASNGELDHVLGLSGSQQQPIGLDCGHPRTVTGGLHHRIARSQPGRQAGTTLVKGLKESGGRVSGRRRTKASIPLAGGPHRWLVLGRQY
jgi:hypothetical protein